MPTYLIESAHLAAEPTPEQAARVQHVRRGFISWGTKRALTWSAFGALLLACGGRAERDTTKEITGGGSTSDSGASATPSSAGQGGAGAAGTGSAGAGLGGTFVSTGGSGSACPADVPSASEIALTPRADQNLELLALKLSPGIVADQAIYDRVVRDMALIRANSPELADIRYFAPFDGKNVELDLNDAAVAQIEAGSYHALDCLNDLYVVEGSQFSNVFSHATEFLTLKGIYNSTRVAKQYAMLPGVDGADTVVGGGSGPTICLTREEPVWHYVLDRASGDCIAGCTDHEYHHFTTTADGALTSLGSLAPDQVGIYASRDACD